MKFVTTVFLSFIIPFIATGDLRKLNAIEVKAQVNELDAVKCSKLPGAFENWNNELRELQNQTGNYFFEIADVMYSWYFSLSPYEGKTVNIDYGAFTPIKNSADTVEQSVGQLAQTYQSMDDQYTALLQKLSDCLESFAVR